MSVEELREEALRLNPEARARLAREPLASLDAMRNPTVARPARTRRTKCSPGHGLAEQISALETEDYLALRAKRASRTTFDRALSKVPDVEPENRDRI
jgi:hypothetical protein